MKLVTILGTRPEIIRLSQLIPKLDELFDHYVLHTGQNYDENLDSAFFAELSLREPDHNLGARGTFGKQAACIFEGVETAVQRLKPDKFLVLGDTNSSLGAVVAARMGIAVYHMEAGNRCFNPRSPEEINRRMIDHVATVHLAYSSRSANYLVSEGCRRETVYVIGNPIYEVMEANRNAVECSKMLSVLGLDPGRYFLCSLHREENVDDPQRLQTAIKTLEAVSRKYAEPVIVSTHPRTRKRLTETGYTTDADHVRLLEPLGFCDWLRLERDALCVLTDSGTVCEEAAILRKPCVVLRESTERVEAVECGSSVTAGLEEESVVIAVQASLSQVVSAPPEEYLRRHVSDRVAKILSALTPLTFGKTRYI